MAVKWLLVLCGAVIAIHASQKCDHTPSMVREGVAPLYNDMFEMTVLSQGKNFSSRFLPDQKYVVTIRTKNSNHTFRWFMITVEDPEVDKSSYTFRGAPADVGRLKTLDKDRTSKYAERCLNTVENIDNAEKETVTVHWLSPKSNSANKVRIRAMVAKNAEAWYVEPDLSVELTKNTQQAIDSPPINATAECGLCSEARYEVIFKGQWSRLTHPQKFPDNVDNNGYSYMVGASHDYDFTLWEVGAPASPGLKLAAETADTSLLEREVLKAVGFRKNSTRTLIRGRRNAHPNMFNPSHALFRVDNLHHLFSVVIAIQPSPDWFLGAQKFNLCSKDEWLESFDLPLYPWDAGTMDGVSYNSNRKMTTPTENVGRVALGSFDKESPFYQLNLNDLEPFARLKIRLLDVYPVKDCQKEDKDEADNLELPGSPGAKEDDEDQEGPQLSEYRADCGFSEWESWSPCSPDGHCGSGNQYRVRYRRNWNRDYSNIRFSNRGLKMRQNGSSKGWYGSVGFALDLAGALPQIIQLIPFVTAQNKDNTEDRLCNHEEKCTADLDKKDTEYQECYVDCY